MNQICLYDPDKDIKEVDKFGYVDLVTAFEKHNVPGDLQSAVGNYDGDPAVDAILNRPRDNFEAMRQADAILMSAKQKSEAKSSSEN